MTATSVWSPDRLDRARARMAELDVDGLLVTPGSDLRYLTGYAIPALSRLTCFVLPVVGDPVLVVPELEVAAARASAAGGAGVTVASWNETDDPAALAARTLPDGASRIGLSGRTWFDHALDLQHAVDGGTLVSAGPVLGHLRARKSPDEVEAMRSASAALDAMFFALAAGDLPVIGRSEREIFRDVRDLMLEHGHADGSGNLASGPHTASPHHKAGDRRLAWGDVLLVDMAGPMGNGYFSDCTRIFTVGEVVDAEFAAYYEVIDAANQAAFSVVAPGVLASEVDRAARDVITAAGYGPAFVTRTGHGIGLDVHESPFMVAGEDVPLEEGMCFSIEPGIYLAGRHGARIEDIVTVTATGAERLNRTGHELAVLTA